MAEAQEDPARATARNSCYTMAAIVALKTILIAPVIVAQAFWVALRAPRLPEAMGAREGQVGSGPPIRLLIVGDSSAAGVGVSQQADALAGQVTQRLSKTHLVSWRLLAKSGATAASTLNSLQDVAPDEFDVAIVSLGVNDTKNAVPLKTWLRNMQHLLSLLRSKFAVQHIYVSTLPPVGQFPLLPQPLRKVLGHRAERFTAALFELLEPDSAAHLVATDFTLDTTRMASDGFHPGPLVYAEWAETIAAEILKDLADKRR